MKKWMMGLAALMLLMTISATAMAGVGDQVERFCTYCASITSGEILSIDPSESGHSFTFRCHTCGQSSVITENHGGDSSATCSAKGTCTICGYSYYDPDNHPSIDYIVEDVEPNDHFVTKVCTECKATIFSGYEHHTYNDYLTEYRDRNEDTHWKLFLCKICKAAMAHSPGLEPHAFSEATCVAAPTCVCGRTSGSIDPNNHDWGDWFFLDNGQHVRACLRDGCDEMEFGYHSGGEATTTEQAICEFCHAPYGGLVPDILSPAKDTTVTVYEGERATMTVTAKNAAAYQWWMSTDGGMNWIECGENSPTYTTSPTKMENNGYLYMCVVTGMAAPPDKEERPPEEEIPSGPALMSLRSLSRSTDDALPDKELPDDVRTVESPIFTLEVMKKDAIPHTGDGSHPELWLALGLASVAALAVLALRGRRKRAK